MTKKMLEEYSNILKKNKNWIEHQNEIVNLYKNHNNESYLTNLKNNLNRVAPFFSEKWNSIK